MSVIIAATEACSDAGFLCELVYDVSGSETAADWVVFVVGGPLKIVLILVAAWVVTRITRRSIHKLGAHLEERSADATAISIERSRQRIDAVSGVLRSVASATIWTIAVMLVLAQLGISLGPLLAGAGIAGVALGFGAQSLVADFLSGFFMLVEDQFGIGDFVDIGEAEGKIEKVSLRTTVVRDVSGTLWHVPNSQILRVGNRSQLWARAVLDIGVAYGASVDEAESIMQRVAHDLAGEPEWSERVLEEPEVLGVQELAADQVTIRMTIKTSPAEQWSVERELRHRIKIALDDAGIEIPFPQRTVWIHQDA